MKARITLLILLLMVVFVVNVAAAEKMSAKEKDIRKLFEVNGTQEMMMQSMDQMIELQKQAMPNIPAKFWSDFKNELNTDDLIELIIPIYDKYFSHDDIKGMIKFYGSPLGKKILKVQPAIMQESMQAGAKWGEAIGRKIGERLQKEGY